MAANILLNYLRFRPRGMIANAKEWIDRANQKAPLDLRFGPGQAYWHHQHPELLTYPPPFNAELGRLVEEFPLRICVSQPSALYRLLDCRIHGEGGVVLSPEGKVFQEFTYSTPNKPHQHSIFRRRRFADPVTLRGSWATVAYPSSFAWFHWVAESLPRFKLIEQLLPCLNGVFIPSSPHAQVRESAQAMGLRPDQIIELNSESHYQPEVLFVPHYAAGMNMAAWVPQFLQARLLPDFDHAHTKHLRRIYVTRDDARVRRLVNEVEIIAMLRSQGFEVVRLADHSFANQAKLFHQAEVVVAPHGAGLANLVFCQPGVRVLELLSNQEAEPGLYFAISNTVGGHYGFLRGQTLSEQDAGNFNADFRVDPCGMEKALAWLIRQP